MKPENLNPKAREAFAKTLIDVGVSVFKGIILLLTVIPIAAIFKSAFDGVSIEVSLIKIIGSMTIGTYITLLTLLIIAFFIGHLFRKEGLRHLHEIKGDI
ncbi:hypothetical protein [Pseudomonas sp.]|uniref:hypothetical protein n=1 Tax=Pseudomonas sp. TaxID=306 RepID=UPI00273237FD|nr:hypothetical protein [Pseudomonas sp.]MDP3816146.1 hypothetical protein [Pseudomonas sp.]